ncbi:MAG: hypothetical protein ACR2PI_13940, partial [Hyphomicrobiaceae bacterium]
GLTCCAGLSEPAPLIPRRDKPDELGCTESLRSQGQQLSGAVGSLLVILSNASNDRCWPIALVMICSDPRLQSVSYRGRSGRKLIALCE